MHLTYFENKSQICYAEFCGRIFCEKDYWNLIQNSAVKYSATEYPTMNSLLRYLHFGF